MTFDELCPNKLRVIGGELVCTDNQPANEYLAEWAVKENVGENEGVNLICRETLMDLYAELNTKRGDAACSFCGKKHEEVIGLIEGANSLICNECVEVCVQMFVEQKKKI